MAHCYSTGDGNVSFRKGTLASLGEYDWTCASFGSLESTTDTANGSVQSFLHSLWQKVPILYNGRPYPPELPLPMGDLDLPFNTRCFRPKRVHNPNGTSIGSAVFAQMTADCLYTLQWFACFPSKLPHPNPYTSGGVIAGRVNIVETRHKVFPILGDAFSPSNKTLRHFIII